MSPQPDSLSIQARTWRRDQRLKALGYEDYRTYTSSVYWRGFRARYQRELPWRCDLCECGDPLVLHHLTYDSIGQERLEDVVPLCPACHGMVHQMERDYEDVGISDFGFIRDEVRAKRHRLEAAARKRALDTETLADKRARMLDRLDAAIRRAEDSPANVTRIIASIDRRVSEIERDVKRARAA